MKKYEYTFSIRAGFEPYKEHVITPEQSVTQNPEEIDVKNILENVLKYIEQHINVVSQAKQYLEKVQAAKDKETSTAKDDEEIELHKYELKTSFVNKYLGSRVDKTEKKVSFAKLSTESQDELIRILEDLLRSLENYQEEIKRELEKSLPNHTNTREIIRKLLSNPDITFASNRLISTTSLLEDLFESTDFEDVSWQNFVSTGKYREFKLFLEENINLLSKKKEVLKASFNRATVNKSYTPEEVKRKIRDIEMRIESSLKKFLKEREINTLQEYLKQARHIFPECSDNIFEPENLSLKEAAGKLKKLYKNCLKKKFNKALENAFNTNKSLEYSKVLADPDIQKAISFVFDQESNNFEKYFKTFLQAKQRHFEIDKENKKEKEQAAKDAGEKFTAILQRCASKFIKIKNKVAREYGNLRAQAKSLDNTRFFLSHLALFAFEKGKEFDSEHAQVLFIPKISMKNKALDKAIESAQQNSTHTIYELHSLTLSALKNKLIAKNASALKPYLNTESYPEYVAVYAMKAFMCKFFIGERKYPIKISLDELDKKVFLEIINALNKVKSVNLGISDDLRTKIREEIIIPSHLRIDEFREALENKFYYLKSTQVNLEFLLLSLNDNLHQLGIEEKWKYKEKNIFAGKVQFGQIRNRRYIREFTELLDDIKIHRINHVRLNPEITLFFSEKEPEKAKHEKSRFNKGRFIIQFNYTKNKPGKLLDAKFSDDEELRQAYEKFNKDLEPKIELAKESGKYTRVGIDVGTSDFVSVAFFENWEKKRDIQQEGFPFKEVEVYKIKNEAFTAKAYIKSKNAENGIKEVVLWQNPSYFLHEDENKRAFKDKTLKERVSPDDYTEKLNLHAFDTSSAKVISGKICINADLSNYLRLMLIPVVQKMLQLNMTITDLENIDFGNKGIIFENIKDKDGNSLEISIAEEFKANGNVIVAREIVLSILNKLYELIQNIKDENEQFEYLFRLEKNLKKIIASNISAALVKLATENDNLPEFFVENEMEEFLTDQEAKRFGIRIDKKSIIQVQYNITRELFFALLYKLQKHELVPPKINRQFLLRRIVSLKDIKDVTFGVVHFISAQGTSQLCPACLSIKHKKDKCKKCDFSKPNQNNNYGINNPDIQAATVLANPGVIEALEDISIDKQ